MLKADNVPKDPFSWAQTHPTSLGVRLTVADCISDAIGMDNISMTWGPSIAAGERHLTSFFIPSREDII